MMMWSLDIIFEQEFDVEDEPILCTGSLGPFKTMKLSKRLEEVLLMR